MWACHASYFPSVRLRTFFTLKGVHLLSVLLLMLKMTTGDNAVKQQSAAAVGSSNSSSMGKWDMWHGSNLWYGNRMTIYAHHRFWSRAASFMMVATRKSKTQKDNPLWRKQQHWSVEIRFSGSKTYLRFNLHDTDDVLELWEEELNVHYSRFGSVPSFKFWRR